MKPVSEWDEAYLLELISVGEQESLTLDYKRSAALAKDDTKKNDLSKDVSAFANSAGGVLVYGMKEDKHVPTDIDEGVDRNVITKEWLESVIKGRISLEVENVVIKQIALPSRGHDKVAYAVQIPAATSRAPHQACDHRYYKRFNFESTPMEDYEVRDLMRRSIEHGKVFGVAWDLLVEFRKIFASATKLNDIPQGEFLPRTRLQIAVSDALRSSGVAIMALPNELRQKAAQLVNAVDEYNSIIWTIDTGQREEARLNATTRELLEQMKGLANVLCGGLLNILNNAP
jgi:hypothetical protein